MFKRVLMGLAAVVVSLLSISAEASPTTNDLGAVLRKIQTTAGTKNPFADMSGDGMWTFKTAGGTLLGTDYAPIEGMYGYGSASYPMLTINVTDKPLAMGGTEVSYAPGDVRAHPGNTATQALCIDFMPSRSGVYKIEGSIRAATTTFQDGVTLTEAHGYLPAPVVTTAGGGVHFFASGEIGLVQGDGGMSFVISPNGGYACDATVVELRIIRLGDFTGKVISSAIADALTANPTGYGDTVETDWMSVSVGRTTSVGGALTALAHGTSGTALVGWQNTGATSDLPVIYSNVSDSDTLLFSTDTSPVKSRELVMHPGYGVYCMMRFVSKVSGDYGMHFYVRDCNGASGNGVAFAVLVNGTQIDETNVDNGGVMTSTLTLEELQVGDVVDFVLRSRTQKGKSTNGDSSAVRIDMFELDLGDARALQALLDAGGNVEFPGGEYKIDRSLVIHSGTTLTCSDDVRLQPTGGGFPLLVNEHSGAGTDGDITIVGGLWDGQNLSFQASQTEALIALSGVTNLSVRGLTVKDPVSCGIRLADVEGFCVENIGFDCNGVTPGESGVVVNGFARRGAIRNLSGRVGASFVVLDADGGAVRSAENDITDIVIDTIVGGETGVSGIDLVTRQATVSNLTICNVSGVYDRHVVLFSSGTGAEAVGGRIDGVTVSNVTAISSATSGRPEDGIIWFREGAPDIGFVRIEALFRAEDTFHLNAVDTISVGAGVRVGRMELYDVLQAVSGEQRLLAVDPSAVIGELVQGGSDHALASVKVPGERFDVPARPELPEFTNSLSAAIAKAVATRQNPVASGDGIWSFRRASGELLTEFCDRGNGIVGLQAVNKPSEADATYPKIWVNVTNVSAQAQGGEVDLEPGECYAHPGNSDAHRLQVIFQPTSSNVFTVAGDIRTLVEKKTLYDGVIFSGSDLVRGQEFFRSELSKTVSSAHIATDAFPLGKGSMLSLMLDRKSGYEQDGTGLDLSVASSPVPAQGLQHLSIVNVTSNLNALARARGIYGYPDETVVNGISVTFGKWPLPDGPRSEMERFVVYGADFVGWRNGMDAATDADAEASSLPSVLLNRTGGDCCPPGADRAAHPDEVVLSPGRERASVCRLTARRSFAGRQELSFRLRDLQTSPTLGDGVECRFLLNGTRVGQTTVLNGGESMYDLMFDGLAAGDIIDVVVQSLNGAVGKQVGDLTAVSMSWSRSAGGFLLMIK